MRLHTTAEGVRSPRQKLSCLMPSILSCLIPSLSLFYKDKTRRLHEEALAKRDQLHLKQKVYYRIAISFFVLFTLHRCDLMLCCCISSQFGKEKNRLGHEISLASAIKNHMRIEVKSVMVRVRRSSLVLYAFVGRSLFFIFFC